jgi:acetyl-CoA acyltransferase
MALASQFKAVAAQQSGFFDAEITPVTIPQKKGDPIAVTRDEHPRETSLEALGKLKGVVRPDGSVTPATPAASMTAPARCCWPAKPPQHCTD